MDLFQWNKMELVECTACPYNFYSYYPSFSGCSGADQWASQVEVAKTSKRYSKLQFTIACGAGRAALAAAALGSNSNDN